MDFCIFVIDYQVITMMKKKPPVEISKAEMEYLGTLKERDRRHFIACKASGPNGSSIKAVCEAFGCSPNTVSKAIFELMNHIVPPDGRQRMPGGGAKRKIDKHPEWVAAFDDIVSSHKAGLPQDECVVWLDLTVPQIRRLLLERGHDVSDYIVRQMLAAAGLRRRSFVKSLPLREAEDRVVHDKDSHSDAVGEIHEVLLDDSVPVGVGAAPVAEDDEHRRVRVEAHQVFVPDPLNVLACRGRSKRNFGQRRGFPWLLLVGFVLL